ncbi:unnamed protein product [Rotaria sordida]|uniref:Uncharacterized protein n=1 Tax=Rotaria sordida TaxID=392033 RepID=A0A815IDV2_9BILA|nr:unnamed protein product [Rotaria sordida]CAF1409747.1 unnamed protein product [Rotaria sordida]CAF3911956.1 unnamed protein product [Rotaria sordida]CAF3926782.1 unnamed protein product [Rotaria sordida]
MSSSNFFSQFKARSDGLNEIYSYFPAFEPPKNYNLIFLHKQTSTEILNHAIQVASDSYSFIIDTQHEQSKSLPSIIQILCSSSKHPPLILLVEVLYLKSYFSTRTYDSKKEEKIKKIFKEIFALNKNVLAWGNPVDKLAPFYHYKLFNETDLKQPNLINIHEHFSDWYKVAFPNCILNLMGLNKRPYSLQKALALVFDEWLNTKIQYGPWNCGIDNNLKTYNYQWSSNNNKSYHEFIQEQIQYREEMKKLSFTQRFIKNTIMRTPENCLHQKRHLSGEDEQEEQQRQILRIMQQLQQEIRSPLSLVTTGSTSFQQQQHLQGQEVVQQMVPESEDELLLILTQGQQQVESATHAMLSQQQFQYQQQFPVENYVPLTLKEYNKDRWAYLPTFPYLKSDKSNDIPLLLANVSSSILGSNDLNRRYATCYDGPFIAIILSDQMNSYMYDCFKRNFNDLIERLKINPAIIDFNLRRWQRIIERFQLLQRIFSRRFTRLNNNNVPVFAQQDMNFPNNLLKLDEVELKIGLEFFLQIDVDLFYMKTCVFRDARPRSLDEGLFCKSQLPIVRYSFQACHKISCTLCESSTAIIQFDSGRTHRFVNGYHAILNCPVTCQTKNIIYALTCPCGEYDFIGSTSSNISEVIESIRENGSQYMHETLISINSSLCSQKEFIRLYQHAAHCSKAIQLFLNVNTAYDCFIPMTFEQAMMDDRNQIMELSPVSDFSDLFMQYVPIPPKNYIFSNCQQEKQRKFFEKSHLIKSDDEKLFTSVDFYNVSVITVLPENCSTLLRQVLECLFATHAETKLNMFNLRTKDTYELYGLPYHRVWCENIGCSTPMTS